MSSLELIEAMRELSTRMVAAAQANDWDVLVGLEGQFADLRRQLAILEPSGVQQETLTAEQRAYKAKIIEGIQADEAEIRSHVEPWMNSTRRLLSSDARARNMRAAYGAIMP